MWKPNPLICSPLISNDPASSCCRSEIFQQVRRMGLGKWTSVRCDGFKSTVGSPQGCVSDPLLFLLNTDRCRSCRGGGGQPPGDLFWRSRSSGSPSGVRVRPCWCPARLCLFVRWKLSLTLMWTKAKSSSLTLEKFGENLWGKCSSWKKKVEIV